MVGIFIGNLAKGGVAVVTESNLKPLFELYGTVEKVQVKKKGFGFVHMPDAENANKAIEKLNGYEIAGKRMQVRLYEKKGTQSKPEETFETEVRCEKPCAVRGGAYQSPIEHISKQQPSARRSKSPSSSIARSMKKTNSSTLSPIRSINARFKRNSEGYDDSRSSHRRPASPPERRTRSPKSRRSLSPPNRRIRSPKHRSRSPQNRRRRSPSPSRRLKSSSKSTSPRTIAWSRRRSPPRGSRRSRSPSDNGRYGRHLPEDTDYSTHQGRTSRLGRVHYPGKPGPMGRYNSRLGGGWREEKRKTGQRKEFTCKHCSEIFHERALYIKHIQERNIKKICPFGGQRNIPVDSLVTALRKERRPFQHKSNPPSEILLEDSPPYGTIHYNPLPPSIVDHFEDMSDSDLPPTVPPIFSSHSLLDPISDQSLPTSPTSASAPSSLPDMIGSSPPRVMCADIKSRVKTREDGLIIFEEVPMLVEKIKFKKGLFIDAIPDLMDIPDAANDDPIRIDLKPNPASFSAQGPELEKDLTDCLTQDVSIMKPVMKPLDETELIIEKRKKSIPDQTQNPLVSGNAADPCITKHFKQRNSKHIEAALLLSDSVKTSTKKKKVLMKNKKMRLFPDNDQNPSPIKPVLIPGIPLTTVARKPAQSITTSGASSCVPSTACAQITNKSGGVISFPGQDHQTIYPASSCSTSELLKILPTISPSVPNPSSPSLCNRISHLVSTTTSPLTAITSTISTPLSVCLSSPPSSKLPEVTSGNMTTTSTQFTSVLLTSSSSLPTRFQTVSPFSPAFRTASKLSKADTFPSNVSSTTESSLRMKDSSEMKDQSEDIQKGEMQYVDPLLGGVFSLSWQLSSQPRANPPACPALVSPAPAPPSSSLSPHHQGEVMSLYQALGGSSDSEEEEPQQTVDRSRCGPHG